MNWKWNELKVQWTENEVTWRWRTENEVKWTERKVKVTWTESESEVNRKWSELKGKAKWIESAVNWKWSVSTESEVNRLRCELKVKWMDDGEKRIIWWASKENGWRDWSCWFRWHQIWRGLLTLTRNTLYLFYVITWICICFPLALLARCYVNLARAFWSISFFVTFEQKWKLAAFGQIHLSTMILSELGHRQRMSCLINHDMVNKKGKHGKLSTTTDLFVSVSSCNVARNWEPR